MTDVCIPVSCERKADFPIYKKMSSAFSYLDNAATTHSPQVVIQAVSQYYEEVHSNPHSASHTLSERTTRQYHKARETVARFIAAPGPEQIIFCHSTTMAINMVAMSYLQPRIQAGDEILVTAMEHHANLLPWQQLAKRHQATLRVVPLTPTGEIDQEAYHQMLSTRTVFVALTHVSNVLGTINPVASLVASAKSYGIPVLLDGAQAISHTPVDVTALGCDFYVFSGHKAYGPTGIGVLYASASAMEKMTPCIFGGGMIEAVSYTESSWLPNQVATFEPGTPNVSGAIGLAAALDYLTQIGWEEIISHEQALLQYALSALDRVPQLQIYGRASDRVGVLSFTLADIHAHDITSLLNDQQVAVRGGHHCAMPLIHELGLVSVTRASLGVYNDEQDIDALVNGLRDIYRVFQL